MNVDTLITLISLVAVSESASNLSPCVQEWTKWEDNGHKRQWPFCVGTNMLRKYSPGSGVWQDVLEGFINFRPSGCLHDVLAIQSPKLSTTFESASELSKLQFSIIENYSEKRETRHNKTKALNQWIHIALTATRPLNMLAIQANALPLGMPYGQFNIDFLCNDCGGGDRQGEFVVPCSGRTHVHSRHPNIYTYKGSGKSHFHINYSFLDTTCQEVKYIQFMIVHVFFQSNLYQTTAFYTPIIDHNAVHHTLDGIPYPFHQEIAKNLKCHGSQQKIKFVQPEHGRSIIQVYPPYEQCIRAKEKNSSAYVDTDMEQSDLVCSNIPRVYCPHDRRVAPIKCEGFNQETNMFNTCGQSGSVCGKKCRSIVDSTWSDELYRRLIRRTYLGRVGHGALMIFAMIALSNISIHIARYFKETGGGFLMVGWWLWTHLACSIVSVLCLWAGVALVLGMPSRGNKTPPSFTPVVTKEYIDGRDQQVHLHYWVASSAMLVFHVNAIFGAIRPMKLRSLWISGHAAIGYLTLVLGVVSTWFSTACLETRYWTIAIACVAILPWIAGCFIQVFMDQSSIIRTGRSYFPVIEARRVMMQIPMKASRAALLGCLILLTYIFVVIVAVKSSYEGILVHDACKNCPWKLDEVILSGTDSPVSGHQYMYQKFKCEGKFEVNEVGGGHA